LTPFAVHTGSENTCINSPASSAVSQGIFAINLPTGESASVSEDTLIHFQNSLIASPAFTQTSNPDISLGSTGCHNAFDNTSLPSGEISSGATTPVCQLDTSGIFGNGVEGGTNHTLNIPASTPLS